MRDKAPHYDREKHRLYSRSAARLVRNDIDKRCHGSEALMWEKVKEQWSLYVEDLVPLGGKKNGQAGSVYDAVLLFAYWNVLPRKMTRDEFGALCDALWVPTYERIRFADFNWKFLPRVGHMIFSHLAEVGEKHLDDWPGNYKWDVAPYDPEIGVRYRFLYCPIAGFAKAHGFTFLMSAMCNSDYPMLKCIKAGLIRKGNCATDCCCDYWIVGDKSEHLQAHPEFRDEDGYIRNK